MTEVPYSAWQPERLNELIRSRVRVLNAINSGRFDEAAKQVDRALTEVVPTFSELPEDPDSMIPLTQVAGLLGDAAVVAIGRGRPKAAARYLANMTDVQAL